MAQSDVKVVISGDSKSFEKALDRAGDSTKQLVKDFDRAEDQSKSFGKAMDRASEATDASEGKFMGAADLLDGLGGAFGLPTEGATNLARSFGDLTGGFTALGPMIGGLGGSFTAMLGPMLPVIAAVAAVAAGLVLLWKHSETFRDIVGGAFKAVKAVVGPVLEAIGGALSWVGGLFGKGGDDSKDMAEDMKAAAEESAQAWEDWKNAVTGELDAILNPLHRARDNSKTSLDEMTKNLIDNATFYSGWIKNLNSLTDRGFGELAGYFHTLGPEAEKAVGEAYKMSDRELGKLQELFRTKMGKAGDVAGQALYDGIGNKDWQNQGATIGNEIKAGLLRSFPPGSIGESLVNRTGGLLGLPARASGGPVTAGNAYLVGEQGPEVFVPGMHGGIIPNGATAGGGTTVIQLVLDGRVVTEVVHDGLLAKQRRTPLGIAS